MIIKKHKDKNEYILSRDGHWVRNFTKRNIKAVDINDLLPLEDIKLALNNELKNTTKPFSKFEVEDFKHEKIVIVGDGYNFDKNLKIIESLPPDVVVVGVNGAFAKWNSSRRLNYYIVNNPYQECLFFYPQLIKSWPKCIASKRTNPDFLDLYKGSLYVYNPAINHIYNGDTEDVDDFIDDYRNPVCAALNIAYRFKAKKIMLMSILEMYETERPGSEVLKEGLWIYPPQKMALSLIDANLYWLKMAKINVSYTDGEPDYEFATYISEKDIKGYFNE